MNSATSFQESIAIRGDLEIVVRDSGNGQVLQRIEIRNKIMLLAADVLVDLIAQRATDAAPAVNQIYSMRMGSSNTAASRNDYTLGTPVIGKVLADGNKTTGLGGELIFTSTLGTGEANGSTMREAGLFTKGSAGSPTPTDAPGTGPTNPRMFARQTHPDIPKTSAISLEYTWRIAFTA